MKFRRITPILLVAIGTLLAGCGGGDGAAPSALHFVGRQAITDLLVTYTSADPCASVATATPVQRVPAACAAAWRPFGVSVVPGQDLLRSAPPMPSVSAAPGVTDAEAARFATAYWRTQAFKWFALQSRQIVIVDGLGSEHFFRRASAEVAAVAAGARIDVPLCHAFPASLRVVVLAPDFTHFERRTGRTLGVIASFSGPCSATATDSGGAKRTLYALSGRASFVFVGDLGSQEPFGPVLLVTGLGDCSRAEVVPTCER